MEIIQVQIEHELNSIRNATASDFSALAWMDRPDDHLISWKLASGKSNDKYRGIVKKTGRGLSGTVIRLGSPLIIDMTVPDIERLRSQYPIMLAEKLQSAVGVPVFIGGEPRGVLLIGSRSAIIYPKEVVEEVKTCAKRLAVLMNPSL